MPQPGAYPSTTSFVTASPCHLPLKGKAFGQHCVKFDDCYKGDQQQKLIDDYDDHELGGDWKGHRELHVLADWLLIYYLEDDVLVLTLSRTGTHSDLFKK